jgi:hypothetical protein
MVHDFLRGLDVGGDTEGLLPAARDKGLDPGPDGSHIVRCHVTPTALPSLLTFCSGYNIERKYRIPHTSITKIYLGEGSDASDSEDKLMTIQDEIISNA